MTWICGVCVRCLGFMGGDSDMWCVCAVPGMLWVVLVWCVCGAWDVMGGDSDIWCVCVCVCGALDVRAMTRICDVCVRGAWDVRGR